MYDQHLAGFFHGSEDRFRIEWDQRADVDDFHVPVMLFLQPLGDTEAEMRGIAICDHAQVAARPADTGFPERNFEVFRHKTGCFDRVILAHGAGRVLSRSGAKREFTPEEISKDLADKGIILKANSQPVIAEEAPNAYKDVDSVVKTADKTGISKLVAQMKPLGVIKG